MRCTRQPTGKPNHRVICMRSGIGLRSSGRNPVILAALTLSDLIGIVTHYPPQDDKQSSYVRVADRRAKRFGSD